MAGGGIGEAGAGLRRGQGGVDKDRRLLLRVQEVQQVPLLLRHSDRKILRQAGAGLPGEAGSANDKKPLHAIGQQLVTHPSEDRAKQNGFQHQRFGVRRNGRILLQKEHGALRMIHG